MALIRTWAGGAASKRCVPDVSWNSERLCEEKEHAALRGSTEETGVGENCREDEDSNRAERGRGLSHGPVGDDHTQANRMEKVVLWREIIIR